jgi:hypothetical protein
MKRYMFRNSEGLYLNTDYHSSARKGKWRSREDARLYKSIPGIAAAFRAATPAVKRCLGVTWKAPPFGQRWTDSDRDASRALWQGFSKLSTKKKLALWAEDGYTIEEVEV